MEIKSWLSDYLNKQIDVINNIDLNKVESIINKLYDCLKENKQIFICGNGGSASNSSHFATDLGKSASEALNKKFKIISLNENIAWMTAIANDYAYEDVFVKQLENYANAGDVLIVLSVSGVSPNIVKAIQYATEHGLYTIRLMGNKEAFNLKNWANTGIMINSDHYGRVEDAEMMVCHLICYYFMENKKELKL